MCNPTGCTFCALISVFGAIMMFILGICIKNNYPYLGEWYHPEEGKGSPTQDQIDIAAHNCFAVMGIYMGFTVMALMCLCWQNSKAKRS